MLPQEIIRRKGRAQALEAAEIQAFVRGIVDRSWTEGQVAAFAMAVRLRERQVGVVRVVVQRERAEQRVVGLGDGSAPMVGEAQAGSEIFEAVAPRSKTRFAFQAGDEGFIGIHGGGVARMDSNRSCYGTTDATIAGPNKSSLR